MSVTARSVTAGQLCAYVERAKDSGARVVGFHAAPVWDDQASLGKEVVVAACASSLAVRAAVWDHLAADDGRLLVVLTDTDDIGQEVMARLYRGSLLRPESFEILKDLFRVSAIAQPLSAHQWLADLLVQVAPVGRTFAPPPGGILDLDVAWNALLTHGLQLPSPQPSLQDLLIWAGGPSADPAVATLSEADAGHIADRLAAQLGPSARCLIQLLRAGQGADAIPLGLVVAVAWSSTVTGEEAGLIRGRLETWLAGQSLSASAARSWGVAAEGLVREAATDPDQSAYTAWTARAAHILTEIDGRRFLGVSGVLPGAFDARLDTVGTALARAVDDPSQAHVKTAERAAEIVRDHAQAARFSHRIRTVEMALRLVRRLAAGPRESDLPTDLAQTAIGYVTEGAWVDQARLALLDGDPVESLAVAVHALVTTAGEERRLDDRRFAQKLAQWTAASPTDGTELMPIERVLDQAVAPAVRSGNPVLVLLIDGLSWAQAHRLFDEMAWRFRRVAPDGRWAPVLSTLPSVTQVSRSSLFTGQPTAGGQDVEREGFASHAGLLDATRGSAPVLFHKASLTARDGHPAPDVREAITNPAQTVVGVVVNGADDHLDKGAQLELAEGLRAIKPLDPLLNWAVEAERAVVVVADHGHIREAGSRVRPAPGGGERWRPAEGEALEDEVLLEGPRVLKGEGRIIAPATEEVRYNPTKKLGYHGGATPQEVLCPLAVFVPGTVEIDDWTPEQSLPPAWWDGRDVARVAKQAPPVRPAPPVDPKGVPMLFDTDNEVSPEPTGNRDDGAPGWIDGLVASDLFAQQQRAAGRQTLDTESVVHLLTHLDRAGGTLTGEAFARAAGTSFLRARSKATALGHLLNIDGYPALTVDGSGEVRLDTAVLRQQFRLS